MRPSANRRSQLLKECDIFFFRFSPFLGPSLKGPFSGLRGSYELCFGHVGGEGGPFGFFEKFAVYYHGKYHFTECYREDVADNHLIVLVILVISLVSVFSLEIVFKLPFWSFFISVIIIAVC